MPDLVIVEGNPMTVVVRAPGLPGPPGPEGPPGPPGIGGEEIQAQLEATIADSVAAEQNRAVAVEETKADVASVNALGLTVITKVPIDAYAVTLEQFNPGAGAGNLDADIDAWNQALATGEHIALLRNKTYWHFGHTPLGEGVHLLGNDATVKRWGQVAGHTSTPIVDDVTTVFVDDSATDFSLYKFGMRLTLADDSVARVDLLAAQTLTTLQPKIIGLDPPTRTITVDRPLNKASHTGHFIYTTGWGMLPGSRGRIRDLRIDDSADLTPWARWEVIQSMATTTAVERVIIEGVQSDNCAGEGMMLKGDWNTLRDVEFNGPKGNGIHLSACDHPLMDNVRVFNANQDPDVGHVMGCIGWSEQIQHATVVNGLFDGGVAGVSMTGETNSHDTIGNNVFKNMTQYGALLQSEMHHAVVSGNRFYDNVQGVKIDVNLGVPGGLEPGFALRFSGNLLDNSPSTITDANQTDYVDNTHRNGSHLLVSQSQAVHVNRNTFYGCTVTPEVLDHCSIDDNEFHFEGDILTTIMDFNAIGTSNTANRNKFYGGNIGINAVRDALHLTMTENSFFGQHTGGMVVGRGAVAEVVSYLVKNNTFVCTALADPVTLVPVEPVAWTGLRVSGYGAALDGNVVLNPENKPQANYGYRVQRTAILRGNTAVGDYAMSPLKVDAASTDTELSFNRTKAPLNDEGINTRKLWNPDDTMTLSPPLGPTMIRNVLLPVVNAVTHSFHLGSPPTPGSVRVVLFGQSRVPTDLVTPPVGFTLAGPMVQRGTSALSAGIWYRFTQPGDTDTCDFVGAAAADGWGRIIEVVGIDRYAVPDYSSHDGGTLALTSICQDPAGLVSSYNGFALAAVYTSANAGTFSNAWDGGFVRNAEALGSSRIATSRKINVVQGEVLNTHEEWTTARSAVGNMVVFRGDDGTPPVTSVNARRGDVVGLAEAADVAYVAADVADVTTVLGEKANTADVTAALLTKIDKAIGTTKGDLLVYDGAAWVRQGVGANGQVWSADSTTGTGGRWITPAAGGGSVAADPIWDAKGDVSVGTGPDAATRFPVGPDGSVWTADSSVGTFGVKYKLPSRSPTSTTIDTGPANTVVETDLASHPVPQTVVNGDIVRLIAYGIQLNNSGGNVTHIVKTYLGTTVLSNLQSVSLATNANGKWWRFEVELVIVSIVSPFLQHAGFDGIIGPTGANPGWATNSNTATDGGRVAAEDVVGAVKNLRVTMTLGTASALASFICKDSWLEIVKRT